MKSFLPLLIIVLFAEGIYAQVGIGTTDPQRELHVAGETSSIRIDGLNATNNPDNFGGTGLYNLRVDSDGDLTLGSGSSQLVSVVNTMSPTNLQTTANSDFVDQELYIRTFTLSQRSIVFISYIMSAEVKSYDNTSFVEDGRAKMIYNYFYLGDGTTSSYTKPYGMESTVYNNSDCDAASGYIMNSQTAILILDAGTHSVHFMGAVYGGGLNSDAAFSTNFGDRERLEVSILNL
ncbi:MAG: hypothetical protein Aureis2KO_06140 [Aureisphaera sp.]